jgi:hypothetical protein
MDDNTAKFANTLKPVQLITTSVPGVLDDMAFNKAMTLYHYEAGHRLAGIRRRYWRDERLHHETHIADDSISTPKPKANAITPTRWRPPRCISAPSRRARSGRRKSVSAKSALTIWQLISN